MEYLNECEGWSKASTSDAVMMCIVVTMAVGIEACADDGDAPTVKAPLLMKEMLLIHHWWSTVRFFFVFSSSGFTIGKGSEMIYPEVSTRDVAVGAIATTGWLVDRERQPIMMPRLRWRRVEIVRLQPGM